MAIEDLDLEFEDEEEIEGSDALEVDVDLSFSAATESSPKSGKKPVGRSATNISALDDTNPAIKLPPKQSHPQQNQQRRPQAQVPQRKPTQQSKQASANSGNVKNIADHKPKAMAQASAQARPQSQVQAKVTSQQVPTVEAQFTDDYAYELQQLRDEIIELKEQMSSIQNQADVKVAVAQAKSEFVIDYVTDAKLVDHQVNQVLQRIHKRVPGLKTEVLTIKKAMSEFVEKTTKKKK